ncbi:hypothetical protein [Synechococcus sp. BA-132 BA5]|uniref:hypothetical protein n=1 Tax=Synechococcus sp. BA-132 BA5 TaxID=3110252 RepID=UPI002B207779|nr:hypothetical protein [Synechococcus sp. BA-132 BA5]MEA5416652.1 hypothetical protein [Synechococcus sp. BA-132 BA5]
MPTARRTSSQFPAEIGKTTARRFPLVHQLIHFADLRNFYREMREALISANRRAGAEGLQRAGIEAGAAGHGGLGR